MKNRKTLFLFSIGLLLVTLLGFAAVYKQKQQTDEPISATAFKLNTVVTVNIYDSKDKKLLDDVMKLCDQYEKLFSRTLNSSEIFQLNNQTLKQEDGAFVLSPETAQLVSKGLYYGKLSNGAFDITIAPVSSLWDFTSEEKQVPSDENIQTSLPFVNYENVSIDGNKLTFEKEGMGLDLGAIAKGYIADKMKEFLVSKGIKSATINLGGNVLCIGKKTDSSPFRIGIQKPFADRSETIAVLDIEDKSVVSSGIYERYFEKDGTFYHHILNPTTGYPYNNHLVSVTIISDQSVDGDGLSTSCFALGLEKGLELINSIPNVHAIFITDDYQLHYSKDFQKELNITYME